MYTIKIGDNLIYHPLREDLIITKGSITHEVGKSSSFTFSILRDHYYYDKFKRLKDIITVYNDSAIIFRGRILNDKTDFRNNKTLTCEGELSFLKDTLIRPYNFTGTPAALFTQFVEAHNSQVDEARKFIVGNITVTDPNDYIARESSEATDTLTAIDEKLVKLCGGYIYITRDSEGRPVLNYLADFPYISDQVIRFGENLTDFARTNDNSAITTALVPYGAKIEDSETRLTIESVNNGLDYIVDDEALATYGFIVKSATWDDVTEPSNLLRKAKEYLAALKLVNITLELSAIDLSLLNKSINQFMYGQYIRIESKPHNVDALFLLTKQSIDILRPDNDKITLGHSRSSFTGETLSSTNKIDSVEKIVSDYKVNVPIITEIVNKLNLEIIRNLPLTQTYDPTTETYSPDYNVNALILTPKATLRRNEVNCSYIWKRVSNGSETALNEGETVASDGTLTVTKNMTDDQAVYKCYATYSNDQTTLVANETVEFIRLSNGEQGQPGKDGTNGRGISTIVDYYLATAASGGVTTSTSGWTNEIQNLTADKKYLWHYSVTTYTDDTNYTSTPVIIGVYGNTGSTGTGIGSIIRQFYISTSKTTQTGGAWVETMPTWSSGKYLWTRLKIVYTNPSSTVYTTPECDSSWEAVNDVQVGGRNYFSMTLCTGSTIYSIDEFDEDNTATLPNYQDKGSFAQCYNLTKPMSYFLGKEAILSFDVISPNGSTPFDVYNTNNRARYVAKFSGISTPIDTEWVHQELKMTVSDCGEDYSIIESNKIEFYASGQLGCRIRNVKLEIGNKATDWTLAPEDLGEVIQSDTEPSNTNKTWLDTSVTPPLLKQWNGEDWIVVNDPTDQLESLRETLINSISQTKDSIMTEVGTRYYTKDEAQTLVSDVNTKLTQTNESFEMQFNKFVIDLESLNNGTNASFEDIRKYIRFEDGSIILGQVGNELILKITNGKISFLQSNNEVAYFSDSKLYITDGEVINSMQIGKFAFIPRANGSLSFKKVGD